METKEQAHTKDQLEDQQDKLEDEQDQSNTNTEIETNTSPTDTIDNTPDEKFDETNETLKIDEEVTSSTDVNIEKADDNTTDANTKESTNATTTSLAQDAMKELFKGVFNDDLANNASAANLAIKAIIDELPASYSGDSPSL